MGEFRHIHFLVICRHHFADVYIGVEGRYECWILGSYQYDCTRRILDGGRYLDAEYSYSISEHYV